MPLSICVYEKTLRMPISLYLGVHKSQVYCLSNRNVWVFRGTRALSQDTLFTCPSSVVGNDKGSKIVDRGCFSWFPAVVSLCLQAVSSWKTRLNVADDIKSKKNHFL